MRSWPHAFAKKKPKKKPKTLYWREELTYTYSGCKVPQIFSDTGLIQHVTGLRQFFFEVLIFHDSSSPKKNSKEYKLTLRKRIVYSKMTTQILKNIIRIPFIETTTTNLPVVNVFYAVFLYHCHTVVESFDFFPGLQC